MRLTIAYSKIKKANLVLVNKDAYQRETNKVTRSTALKNKIVNKRLMKMKTPRAPSFLLHL